MLLHGRKYGSEITPAEEAEAKAAGLLVVFGASDDLTEFRGAIHDEAGAYAGAEHVIVRGPEGHWELFGEPECNCRHARAAAEQAKRTGLKLKAVWNNGVPWTIVPWTITTTFDRFEIMEDGKVYCRGLVVRLP